MGCGIVERHLEMARPTKKQFLVKPDILHALVSAEDEGFGILDVKLHERDVELRVEVVDGDQTPEIQRNNQC